MALLSLLCVLWAACAGSLWAHVYRLPPFQHAPVPLVDRETFKPVPYKSPLPHGLSALLLPGPQPHGGTGPSPPPGPVDVWCGLRRVGVRVDRVRLRHWSDPRLFRLGSCGVSAASHRYLYFHRGLKECGASGQVVKGQLVYTFILTYAAHRHGSVLRAPPLNMVLSCHYNRFHYSYRVGFQPQAQPSTFLKYVRGQNSFSLSVCNSQWEVLPPEHNFLLGEPVFFKAQTGPLRAGERLYVDSCHVTGSNDPGSAPRLDIIANSGCMVDSTRADSSSHFYSRGPSELRFSVDSLLFRAEGQMLFLHCSMSVGLQPSPSSKSCTFNKDLGRWLELEASPSLCSCCDTVCVDPNGADSTTVSSAAWYMKQPADQLYHHTLSVSMKKGQGLTEELHQGPLTLKWREPDLANSIKDDLHQELVSLKSGGPVLTKELQEEAVILKSGGPGLTKELHEEAVNLKSGGPGLTKELQEEAVILKSGGPGLTNELHQGIMPFKITKTVLTELMEAKQLRKGDHTAQSKGDDLEKDNAVEYTERGPQHDKMLFKSTVMIPTAVQNTETQPQRDTTLFKSALTNHTAAQNQSVTAVAADVSG